MFNERLNYKVAVIKNIHEHEIDEEGKDSYKYAKEGASFSITKNIYNETTIFLKQEISIEELIEWIDLSPHKIGIVFTEGFRDLNYPTILCVKDSYEIKEQITENTKIISGIITKDKNSEILDIQIPVLDINDSFVATV